MKIGVLMNVYNEAEWLDCAIGSVFNFADVFVIVEGAYQIAMKAGAPARSDDGTLKILSQYKDNPRFRIIQANEKDEAQQLQKGLEVLKKEKVDWYMLVDGDEIWQPQHLPLIKSAIERGEKSGIYQYRVHFNNFINSFDRVYPAKMKRIFKLTPGAIAVGQNGLAWPDHGKSVDTGGQLSHIAELPEMIKCFHYTEVKAAKRWLLKKSYLKIRDGNPRFDAWKATPQGFVNDEKAIFTYTGDHPKIVKELSGLYKIWKNDPELLRKELFGNV